MTVGIIAQVAEDDEQHGVPADVWSCLDVYPHDSGGGDERNSAPPAAVGPEVWPRSPPVSDQSVKNVLSGLSQPGQHPPDLCLYKYTTMMVTALMAEMPRASGAVTCRDRFGACTAACGRSWTSCTVRWRAWRGCRRRTGPRRRATRRLSTRRRRPRHPAVWPYSGTEAVCSHMQSSFVVTVLSIMCRRRSRPPHQSAQRPSPRASLAAAVLCPAAQPLMPARLL